MCGGHASCVLAHSVLGSQLLDAVCISMRDRPPRCVWYSGRSEPNDSDLLNVDSTSAMCQRHAVKVAGVHT